MITIRKPPSPIVLAAAILSASLATARAQDAPSFEFTFGRCRDIVAAPGTVFSREFTVRNTTTDNASDIGADGWSFSVTSEGVDIVDVTDRGTASASREDDPDGLYIHGFKIHEMATCEETGTDGAIGAVVLSLVMPVRLPPLGTVDIVRLEVEGRAPETEGDAAPAIVRFVDGCVGTGNPANNTVAWLGTLYTPALNDCEFDVRASNETFTRGDANQDGRVDIADATFSLGCHFLRLEENCRRCLDASDVNDDGKADLSDPIASLNFLFLGGPPPAEPRVCGADETEDEFPSCEYSGCGMTS